MNDPPVYIPFRALSKPVADLLSKTRLSPDIFTLLWVLSYSTAAVLFGFGNDVLSIGAAIAIVLAMFFDCLDGDLARARNIASRSGTFLEHISHWFCQGALILGVVVGYSDRMVDLNPLLILGAALVGDTLFHITFLTINTAFDRSRNYGPLHVFARAMFVCMPLNGNILLVSSILTVPEIGIQLWIILANIGWIVAASMYFLAERRHDATIWSQNNTNGA